ncbi:MAG: HRDC domain-containing protein [Enhygromyxa sp.]
MRLKCFAIPALTSDEVAEEVSRFIASHRILTIDRQFVADGSASYWAICVTYQQASEPSQSKHSKVDYREVLSAEDFAVYARLRVLRKELAQRDAVPAYAIFTNEQLAVMARERIDSLAQLGSIPGVGASKVQKYGEAFLTSLRQAPVEQGAVDATS